MTDANAKDTPSRGKPFAEAVPSASEHLKARKQQVVRDALRSAAVDLFQKRGFEAVTVEEISQTAGVSRRTFFRYYESKEDVMVEHFDRGNERLLAELAARPRDESPLLAIRNALIRTIEHSLEERDLIRDTTRLMRETTPLRRALMEHRNRQEERIAALMIQRLGATSEDNTPMLLAFLTRALHDSAFNAWYDHETDDIAGLIDDLIRRLSSIVADMPPEFNSPRK